MWECQTLGSALLDFFPGVQRLSVLAAVASDACANRGGLSCSSLLSPTSIICRHVRIAILTGGI